MKCRICGSETNQKICGTCDPGYDDFKDEISIQRKKKNKKRDLTRKRKRRHKEEWQ